MKNIRFIIALIVSVPLLVGCDDFFNLKPSDAIPTEDALNTVADAQMIMNGVYSGFKSSDSYGTALTIYPALMTDAALATTFFTNQHGNAYAWKLYPGSSEVAGMWMTSYAAIYNATFIINNIDGVEGSEDKIKQIKGEAYVARALLHYNLVRLFGKAYSQADDDDLGVPYVTENKVAQPKRNTVKEVYNYIIDDIEMAINHLPSIYDQTYFSLEFAYGLMARVALDMEDYYPAVDYASKVIDSSIFYLSSGFNYINMYVHDAGSEIIWKVGYTPTDAGAAPGYNFYNRNGPTQLPSPDYIPAQWWLDELAEYNDIRKNNIVYTQTGFGWNGLLLQKYPTNPSFDQQGLNMPKPMRLAEMYLIRAEAYAFLNNDDEAADDMETLMAYRIDPAPVVEQKGDALKALIEKERRKELMFEGFHWFDLKRKGLGFKREPQPNTNVANDLEIPADDFRWQWPIPTVELNGNENIEQNEGY